jgi:hypothetical protein
MPLARRVAVHQACARVQVTFEYTGTCAALEARVAGWRASVFLAVRKHQDGLLKKVANKVYCDVFYPHVDEPAALHPDGRGGQHKVLDGVQPTGPDVSSPLPLFPPQPRARWCCTSTSVR